MKIGLWADTHLRYNLLSQFIDKFYDKLDKIVLLGDFFDQFNDTEWQNMEMARFLRENILHNDKFVILMGNHDSYYRYAHINGRVVGGGFSWQKHKAINSILKFQDWDKFTEFTLIDGWLISHAGFHPYLFSQNNDKFDLDYLKNTLKKAKEQIESNYFHVAYGAGKARGGQQPFGGFLWADWDEITPFKNQKQIVGHTIHRNVKIRYNFKGRFRTRNYKNDFDYNTDSLIVGLDTSNKHFGILEEGKLSIHVTNRYI